MMTRTEGRAGAGSDARTPPTAWPGYLACVWALLFAAAHVYWGLGGDAAVPLSKDVARNLMRNRWFVVFGLWGVGVLCLVGAALALALVRPRGRSIPSWLLLLPAWGAGIGMLAYGALGFHADGLRAAGVVSNPDPSLARLHLLLWDPWWFAGSVLFSAAAWLHPSRS